jgi:hypothetical protein
MNTLVSPQRAALAHKALEQSPRSTAGQAAFCGRVLVRAGVLVTSGALFAFAVERIGPSRVLGELKAISGGILAILAFNLVRLLLQTKSWSIALRQDGIDSTATELMFLRLASQAVGYLTVLGPAASEPMKIKLLDHRRGSPTAATLVDSGVYWLSAGLVLIAGSISATFLFGQSRRASILLASVVVATILSFMRRKALLGRLTSWLGERSPRWLRKAVQIENEVRKFARSHPAAIRRMFLLDLACQVLLLFEVGGRPRSGEEPLIKRGVPPSNPRIGR